MYAKLKTHLIGLAAALGFIVVGFSLGEAPRVAHGGEITVTALAQVEDSIALDVEEAAPVAGPSRRGALKRHLSMPFVSFAALLPRQES